MWRRQLRQPQKLTKVECGPRNLAQIERLCSDALPILWAIFHASLMANICLKLSLLPKVLLLLYTYRKKQSLGSYLILGFWYSKASLWEIFDWFLPGQSLFHVFRHHITGPNGDLKILSMQYKRRKEELAKYESVDCGKPVVEAEADMVFLACSPYILPSLINKFYLWIGFQAANFVQRYYQAPSRILQEQSQGLPWPKVICFLIFHLSLTILLITVPLILDQILPTQLYAFYLWAFLLLVSKFEGAHLTSCDCRMKS